ncbi:MAG: hypothetical protein K4571_03025 [Deltaproteobacteria bacterium]
MSSLKVRMSDMAHRIEMSRAVLYGLLSKIWGLATGPVSFLLIATYFTPEIQGYYYTFLTLLALQTFVELGIGTVIQQFASHEWAKLKLDAAGQITGDPAALSRLSSIARVGIKWFGIGGAVLAVALSIGGFIFFSTSPDLNVNWIAPWFALCLLTGITILFQPLWSVLEGCNQVTDLYRYRFFQGILSQAAGWLAIILGAQLWTAAAASFTVIVCAVFFLWKYYSGFFKTILFSISDGPKIKWSRDMLPMQWRIALSWMSGYICFYLFTPVLFKYHGPVVAGQMGMTWSLVGVIGLMAGSWLRPRVPQLAMHASRRKYPELDRLFWRVTRMVILTAVITALSIFIFVILINWVDMPVARKLSSRLFAPDVVAILLLAQILQVSSMPFSSYMRAHKQEPIVHLSVIAAVMIGLSTLTLGKYYGGFGVAWGYLMATVIIIPFVIIIWHKRRKAWIAASANEI